MYQDKEKICVGEQRAEDVIDKLEIRKSKTKKLVRFTLGVLLITIIFCVALLPIVKRVIFISKYGTEAYDTLGLVEEGAYITFGHYEQDNNLENGKEEIEWLVLKVEDGKALVISKYALDCQPYHKGHEKVEWKNCSLRIWLNTDFLNAAFTTEESQMIVPILLAEDERLWFGAVDRVFLWSTEVEENYPKFRGADKKQCQASAYASAQGAQSRGGVVSWWLRDIETTMKADKENRAKCITYAGKEGSCWQYDLDTAVRPVIWIDLKL